MYTYAVILKCRDNPCPILLPVNLGPSPFAKESYRCDLIKEHVDLPPVNADSLSYNGFKMNYHMILIFFKPLILYMYIFLAANTCTCRENVCFEAVKM